MAKDLRTINAELKAQRELLEIKKNNLKLAERLAYSSGKELLNADDLKKRKQAIIKEEERHNALLEERKGIQKADTKDLLAARKSELNIAKSIQKIDSEIVKSNQSILSLLLKGNIAGLLQSKYNTSTLTLQKKQAKSQENFAQGLADGVKNQTLTNKQRRELLSIQDDVGSGLQKEIDLSGSIQDIEGLTGFQKLEALGYLQNQARAREDILETEKEGEEAQERINDTMAKTAGVFALITAAAFKFGEKLDKIGETFGSLSVMGKDFQQDLLDASVEATKLGGGIEDVADITNTLGSDFGLSVDAAAELSGKVFDTSKAIGLSAEEGANLFGTLMQTANLSAEQAESLAEGAFQLARQNGVAPSAVMKDIAGSAEEIAQFTMDGGDNIAEAAVQARKMGLSLSTTAKIADGLLDFESSIAKEVEASVLIGKQLNFQKARELALNNDIAGATKAVVDQLGSEEEFNKLNAIQRKSLADSIGVSVAEMSKLVGQSDKLSLSGALAAGNFEDLLGEEGISTISQLTNTFKSLSASLVNSVGPALMSVTSFLLPVVNMAGALINTLNEMGLILPIVAAALGYFATQAAVAAGKAVLGAYTKMAERSFSLPFPVNIAAGIAGTAAIATIVAQAKSKSKSVDDFKSGPGGITHMSGPAGSFSLNPRDSVLATTNPIAVNDMMTGPAGSMGGNNQPQTIHVVGNFKAKGDVMEAVLEGANNQPGYNSLQPRFG